MQYSFSGVLKTSFDDGAGNSCKYQYMTVLGATDPTVKMTEGYHYRPKFAEVQNPTAAVTITSTGRTDVVGAPAATQTVTIETTGKVTLPANTTLYQALLQITIDSIEHDLLIHDGLQRVFGEQLDPVNTSIADSTGVVVNEAYSATKGIIEADVLFDEVGHMCYVNHATGTINIDTFRITDLALMVGATALYDTDFALGKGVEQGIQMLMMASGLQSGRYGAIVGSVSEYLRDGKFGDLDLPLEVFSLKVSA